MGDQEDAHVDLAPGAHQALLKANSVLENASSGKKSKSPSSVQKEYIDQIYSGSSAAAGESAAPVVTAAAVQNRKAAAANQANRADAAGVGLNHVSGAHIFEGSDIDQVSSLAPATTIGNGDANASGAKKASISVATIKGAGAGASAAAGSIKIRIGDNDDDIESARDAVLSEKNEKNDASPADQVPSYDASGKLVPSSVVDRAYADKARWLWLGLVSDYAASLIIVGLVVLAITALLIVILVRTNDARNRLNAYQRFGGPATERRQGGGGFFGLGGNVIVFSVLTALVGISGLTSVVRGSILAASANQSFACPKRRAQ